MRTFDEIFTAFGGAAALARAIGIEPVHAQTMKARRSIPAPYWSQIVTAAQERGIETVTLEALAEMATAKHLSGTDLDAS